MEAGDWRWTAPRVCPRGGKLRSRGAQLSRTRLWVPEPLRLAHCSTWKPSRWVTASHSRFLLCMSMSVVRGRENAGGSLFLA